MPTFTLARFDRARLEIEQAKALYRAIEENPEIIVPDQRTKQREPGDPWKLRGIPAVGIRGGVGGAIPGTKPGANLR